MWIPKTKGLSTLDLRSRRSHYGHLFRYKMKDYGTRKTKDLHTNAKQFCIFADSKTNTKRNENIETHRDVEIER